MNQGTFGAKPVLLMVCDAGVHTGFANVAHNLINQLWTQYDIHVLAINYLGDPHPIQQKAKLYNPASKTQGDFYGISRINPLIAQLKPALVFFINDPWVGGSYAEVIKAATIPKVLYTPVDAYLIKKEYLDKLALFDHIVPYTKFAEGQLQRYGLDVPMTVIGHGVDTKVFHPVDKAKAREMNGFSQDWFIVNLTDKNQIRKRLDLVLYAFSRWVNETNKPDTIKIHYHGPVNVEGGWDILDLAEVLNIKDRLIITSPHITTATGVPDDIMPWIYGVADMGISGAMGEGWGLTIMERMAMRIPMAATNTAAVPEWANDSIHLIDTADEPWFNINGLNTMSIVPKVSDTIAAFEKLYTDQAYRERLAQKGYNLVTQKKYSWRAISQQFDTVFRNVVKNYEGNKHGNEDS